MSDALFLEALAPGGSSDTSIAPAQLPLQGRLTIGSAKDRVSFYVDGQGVADVHCTIGRLKSGGWALKDLGSDFGTMLNGEAVEASKLNDGDVILIGSRKLRVFSTAQAAGRTSPPPAKSAPKKESSPKAPNPTPKKVSAKPAAKPKAPKAPTSRPQTRELGGYRLEKPLGRGAMGDVYLALQTSLDRKVALKVLKSALAKDATFVQRFRAEARSAARLNHPNIVTVFDVGTESADGAADKHYLSMEYMDGGSLEEQLKKSGPIPWREALEILRDAAAGLVYAETSGIVHRDIKPENLMRNKDGVTKIADLGLAIQVEQEEVESEAGKIFGTPHFLAPEVVRGATATSASDLYSLGATAYRVLSGHTPFEGKDARAILRSALNDEAPSLTARVPGLPEAMASTVHRLLAKDPEDRHPSAAILLAEIERLRQSGGQVGGANVPTAQSAGIPKPLLFGGGALIAASIAAAVLFGGGGDESPKEADRFPTAGADAAAQRDVTQAPQSGNAPNASAASASLAGANNGDTVAGDVNMSHNVEQGDLDNGTTDVGEGSGGNRAENTFEELARTAYLGLGDENLAPADRATRLRALGNSFAGTDIANKAALEADSIEGKQTTAAEATASITAARDAAVVSLRKAAALDTVPFVAGPSLLAMQAVASDIAIGPVNLTGDLAFRKARNTIIDEVMQLALAGGQAAVDAADKAAAEGSYDGTRTALEGFLATGTMPTAEEASILADEDAPASVEGFRALVASAQARLDGMASSEAEFDDLRLRKERAQLGLFLRDGIEDELTTFATAAAAKRVAEAAGMSSEPSLQAVLMERAEDLKAAGQALNALRDGWADPGWRRRSALDPRPGAAGSVDITGINQTALLIKDGSTTVEVPLATWCGSTRALENLYRGRLARDWSAQEARGIATLLAISATVETLRALEPNLAQAGKRVHPAEPGAITASFELALDWARKTDAKDRKDLAALLGERTLVGIVKEQQSAALTLTRALIARDEGHWAHCAEGLERLLKERQDAWIVIILSQGPQQ